MIRKRPPSSTVSRCLEAGRAVAPAIMMIMVALFASCNKTAEAPVARTPAVDDLTRYFPSAEVATTAIVAESSPSPETDTIPPSLLEVTASEPSMVVATTQRLRAVAVFPDGTKRVVTSYVQWAVDESDLAHLVEGPDAGVLRADRAGKVNVVATMNGVSSRTGVDIVDAVFDHIDILPRSLVVGNAQQFHATAVYSNGSTQDITTLSVWSSSNQYIATVQSVSTPGMVKGKTPGSVTLSVRYNGVEASAPIDVRLMDLDSVTLEASSTTMTLGSTVTVKAIGHYKNGTSDDVTQALTWTTSAATIATVNDELGTKGVVTSTGGGTAVIRAALGDVQATVSIEVQTVEFTSFAIEPDGGNVPKGLIVQLRAIGTLADGSKQDVTADAIWASTRPFLASVSNDPVDVGQLTAFDVGETSITASYGQAIAETTVTVIDAAVVSIRVSGPEAPVDCGVEAAQFSATGVYSDAREEDITNLVTWTSTNGSVAIASNDPSSRGSVVSVKAGTATIGASLYVAGTDTTVRGSRDLVVGPPVLLSYKIIAPTTSAPIGTSMQLTALGAYSCTVALPENFTSAVTWSTNNAKVTISNVAASKGFLTSTGLVSVPEIVVLKATKGTLRGEVELEMRPKEVIGVSLSATSDRVDIGASIQIRALVTYSDNSTSDATLGLDGHTFEWSVSQPSLATMDNTTTKGLVTGVSEGYYRAQLTITTPRSTQVQGVFDMGTQSRCTTGVRRDLFCWFAGALNASCTDTCLAASGTYHPATVTYTGSGGTGASCSQVLAGLGLGILSKDDQAGPAAQGVGCGLLSASGVTATRRYSTPATTAGAFHPNVRRVCACSQ